MSRIPTKSLLDYVRGLATEGTADTVSDRVLLQRFASRHDETAFKTIIRRHGPMVLRVCQRWLKRREDAEDVFQATFLVLARKAGALKWRESVGSWLHTVAHRLAQESRRKQSGREAREALAQPRPTQDPLAEVTGRELVGILDEELANLPARYRAPLLLYLEGKSGDEAAQCLGCSPSTLKRRLRHARELLESRLNRRGFALSAALSALLLYNTAMAKLPTTLVASTVQAALLLAAGKPLTAGLVSAEAVALAYAMTHAMLMTKVRLAFVMFLAAGTLLAGTYALALRVLPETTVIVKTRLAPDPAPPVAATIETTLGTEGAQIRQFAFDGDPSTFFASAENASGADHFTLVFDRPVAVKSLAVVTGRPRGDDLLDVGTLEVSPDGKDFEPLAAFDSGYSHCRPEGRLLQAVRVRPGADLGHPLAIREFVVDSDPPVSVFKYPIEFIVNVAEAPEMKEWAERTARRCERAYPMINESLKSDKAFKPVHQIWLTMKNLKDNYTAAVVRDDHIVGSVEYFRQHPDDIGAIVFTTVNCVQNYGNRPKPSQLRQALADYVCVFKDEPETLAPLHLDRLPFAGIFTQSARLLAYLVEHDGKNPRWLVYGIADYIRYFKYEPGTLKPIDPEHARYDGNYQVTAAFLAFVTEKYDRDLVRKLNQIVREGEYREDVFQRLTGKTLQELNEEWRASLRQNHDQPTPRGN
jgi:RNA polymerase sigma factor (sigma-70 family)